MAELMIPTVDECYLCGLENHFFLARKLVLDLHDDQLEMRIMGNVIEIIGGNDEHRTK